MAEQWVVNASPLIVMSKIGQAHLFADLAETVVIPTAVLDDNAARKCARSFNIPVKGT